MMTVGNISRGARRVGSSQSRCSDARTGTITRRSIACVIGCVALTACRDGNTVSSRDQAASVTISVTSVSPWNEVSNVLQPDFDLTSKDALGKVAPITAHTNSESVTNLTLKGRGGVTAAAGAQGSVTGTSAGEKDTTSTAPSSSTPGASSSGQDQTLPAVSPDAMDPILQYKAARALFESVKLMNREVQAVALRPCYVPYLVQLKIAVLPYRRHLPYDVHAHISFFRGQRTPVPESALPPEEQTPCDWNTKSLPQILPLIATDDVERAAGSRSAEAALRTAIELQYTAPGVNGSAGADRLAKSLETIASQDINSRLTVARQTYNTLYVRIGAAFEQTAGYGLVGQTYDVAVLLLVPRGYFKFTPSPIIGITAFNQIRNAVTGEVLADPATDALWNEVDNAMQFLLEHLHNAKRLAAWKEMPSEEKQRLAVALLGAVQASTTEQFVNALCAAKLFGCNEGSKEDKAINRAAVEQLTLSLWPRLSVIRSNSAYQGAFLQLRSPRPVEIEEQEAAGLDEEGELEIRLGGIKGTSTSGMTARLTVLPSSKDGQSFTLLSTGLSFDALAHTLELKFPSPSGLGLQSGKATLSLSWQDCSDEEVCPSSPPKRRDFSVTILSKKPGSSATQATAPLPQAPTPSRQATAPSPRRKK